MNLFDKEERIIDYFQFLENDKILLSPNSLKINKIYKLVHDREKWNNWIDSSSKKELPPDFYNDKDKIMMDIMRIDDHAHYGKKGKIINPTNERESKIVKELIKKDKKFKKIAEKGNLIVIPDSGLRGIADHNYDFYINNFNRVISNHISKIDNYKSNHSNYKVVFFIFDESSPYIECIGEERPMFVGQCLYAYPHIWWNDYNMVKILLNSKIDYAIWMAPFKHFENEKHIELPMAVIFDVSKIRENRLRKYIPYEMESLEV